MLGSDDGDLDEEEEEEEMALVKDEQFLDEEEEEDDSLDGEYIQIHWIWIRIQNFGPIWIRI